MKSIERSHVARRGAARLRGVRSQAGFAIVELVLVVAISGTLATVAVPSYLDAADRADDGSSRATLRTALTVAILEAGEGQGLSESDHLALGGTERSVTFVAGSVASLESSVVSVHADATTWAAATMSESGSCQLVRADADGAVSYGTTTDPARCTGEVAVTDAVLARW